MGDNCRTFSASEVMELSGQLKMPSGLIQAAEARVPGGQQQVYEPPEETWVKMRPYSEKELA